MMKPAYFDFRPPSIEAAEPKGPFRIVCSRCRWQSREVATMVQAVLLRMIHEGTYKHRHPDVHRR